MRIITIRQIEKTQKYKIIYDNGQERVTGKLSSAAKKFVEKCDIKRKTFVQGTNRHGERYAHNVIIYKVSKEEK